MIWLLNPVVLEQLGKMRLFGGDIVYKISIDDKALPLLIHLSISNRNEAFVPEHKLFVLLRLGCAHRSVAVAVEPETISSTSCTAHYTVVFLFHIYNESVLQERVKALGHTRNLRQHQW